MGATTSAWVMFAILEAMVVLQGVFAYLDRSFWYGQMVRRWGSKKCLPISRHGGIWGDLIILSALAAFLMAESAAHWPSRSAAYAVLIGFAASWGMHQVYRKISWPEAHVRGGFLTGAGWVHFLYMASVISIFVLYYVSAPYSSTMLWASVIIVVHVAIGNHVLLGKKHPEGPTLRSPGAWAAIGGTATLTFGCTAYRMYFG